MDTSVLRQRITTYNKMKSSTLFTTADRGIVNYSRIIKIGDECSIAYNEVNREGIRNVRSIK